MYTFKSEQKTIAKFKPEAKKLIETFELQQKLVFHAHIQFKWHRS